MALKPKIVTQDEVRALALSLADADEASAAQLMAFAYAGDVPDYSLEECWLQIPEITKGVDALYIYSTVYVESSFAEGSSDYARLDNPEMVFGALSEYVTNASVFEESANVFAPYYRQAGMRYAGEVSKETGDIDAAISGVTYDDVTAALDYYFENCNQGRPFIIAGHSQGSAIVRLLLKRYFAEHPDYYERMVAAYPIGYSFTRGDYATYPHLKYATGETDTGVIVTWDTEGPKNAELNAANVAILPDGICINPLNWKLDDTYAPASENLGSLVLDEEAGEYVIGDVGADAQLNLERGVVVTNADSDPMEMPELFGPASFHDDDYTFFYNNIKDNVAKRVAAFMASR